MKKINLLFSILFLALYISSCGNDDDTGNGPETVEVDPTEETILDPSSVSQNITISNAERKDGNPPTPTGNIAFTYANPPASAFVDSENLLTFSVPDNFTGAYIQIRSTNGNAAPEYFDVTNVDTYDNIAEIGVQINENQTAGQFCYIICIYDDNGNISDPQEVCVQIENWGGNPNAVGTWNYTKMIRNGETIPVGTPDHCGEVRILCENATDSFTVEDAECEAISSSTLTINADGTYFFSDTIVYTNRVNIAESEATCSPVFIDGDEESTSTSKGKWAYNEEDNILTLIEFEYTEDQYSGTLDPGEVYTTGITTITSNSFIYLTDYEQDGETIEIHFEK